MRTRKHRRPRSRALIAAGVTVLALAGIGVGANVGYASVKTGADRLQAQLTAALQSGQSELEAGRTSLTEANKKHDAALASQALTHFDTAKGHFESAGRLADDSSLLRYLEQVPSLGEQVRSKHTAVSFIADMGAQISSAGAELADLDTQLIKPAPSGAAGRTMLTVLAETDKSLANVRSNLIQAKADADRVDVEVVPEGQRDSFMKARSMIDNALEGLEEYQRLSPVLNEVLGGNGTRTYLIEQVNPAELRAGGGFIGSYSLLRADRGVLTVVKSGDAYELANPRPLPGQQGFIPIPTPYREIIPRVSWSFVDSNIYPDFPSNAQAAIRFAQPRIGKIDGVIAFDYYTVAKMLSLTGPMSVPGYGVTVNSANFVSQIVRLDIAGSLGHKSMLAALAGPLMNRVSATPAERWPTLLTALNDMASQRHLQAYFTNQVVQNEINRVGWSGVVNPTGAADYFIEVEDNYYGDKVNYFLSRHFTIVLSKSGNVLHHTVTVDLTNRTAAGSYARVQYRADVRFFVPAIATAISTNLRTPSVANPGPPSGSKMVGGWLYVQCCGGHGRAVFKYDTPWVVDAKGQRQIYWQKQPGTITDAVDVVWADGAGHSYKSHAGFAQDLLLTLTATGVTLAKGQPSQATLPTLAFG